MKANPPQYEYATDIVGRIPQLKYHKTLGQAKQAFQAKYNALARKHDRIMYRITENGLLEQIYRMPGNCIRPDIMPWEDEGPELLRRARMELAQTRLRLKDARDEADEVALITKVRELEEAKG